MMLARKWDRLENQTTAKLYDIFKAVMEDDRAEGIIDDIRDLRRYLMLVEAEMVDREVVLDGIIEAASTRPYIDPHDISPEELAKQKPDLSGADDNGDLIHTTEAVNDR